MRAKEWNIRRQAVAPAFLVVALLVLALRIVVAIVAEYRSYFPPDFDSAFLIGREGYFFGRYRVAFYVHILVGPPVVLLALVLVLSGVWQRRSVAAGRLHRRLGRVLWPLVVFAFVPSGLLMAPFAFAGLPSAVAFTLLSLATGATAILAIRSVWRGDIVSHRRWAARCFILLMSPLLLRLVGGMLTVLQREEPIWYQLNAWASWLVPVVGIEAARLLVQSRTEDKLSENRTST